MLLRKILVLQYNYLQIDIIKNCKKIYIYFHVLHNMRLHYGIIKYISNMT